MVVRFFPLAAIHSASFWFCSTVIAVSTSTASRLPEMSVEEIGDHFISLAPGGRSLVTAGIWLLIKTSHCNRLVIGTSSRRSRILFLRSLSTTWLGIRSPNCCQLNLPPRTRSLPLSRRGPARLLGLRNFGKEPGD